MTIIRTEDYRKWFDGFVGTFRSGSDADRRNIALKEAHTHRVRENARQIAGGIGIGREERSLAEVVGLLHDVGRFPQYRDHRTFRDSESVNHAALGAQVLIEQGILRGLGKEEQDLIVRAVALHNVFVLPAGLDRRLDLHARIVRDADKLDIWRIFTEVFSLPAADRPSAAGLGLPETPDYAPGVLACLRERRMVKLADLRSLNDFKLLQLAWIYDLNFAPSLRMVTERSLIDGIAATLPADGPIAAALGSLRQYVDERLRS
jgi:hypothetical protein